jgi:uncharacterized damage-inducible protein DinB
MAVRGGLAPVESPEVAALVGKLAEERAALAAVVARLSEPAAEVRRPEATGEDGWSPKEQLAHLVYYEIVYRRAIERTLAEERPDVSAQWDANRYDGDVRFPLARAHEATVPQLWAEAEAERAATIASLDRLSAADLERRSFTTFFPGDFTVLQWLRSFYRHDRMHAAQIEGLEPGFQPRVTRR